MTDVPADVAAPEVDGHYFDTDDASHEVMRCLLILDNGQAVVGSGGSARVVDSDKLQRVPTTAGDLLRVVDRLDSRITDLEDGGKPNFAELHGLVEVVRVWAAGIPVPDGEK